MLLSKLMQTIKEKTLLPFYIFEGEDRTVMDIYLEQLQKEFGLIRVTADEVFPTIKTGNYGSLMSSRKRLVVIRDDKDFISDEKIWPLLRIAKGNVVVLIYSSLDKRSRFYNNFKDDIVTFDKVADVILAKHIRKVLPLNAENTKQLISRTQSNYGYIQLELDKVENYASGINKDPNDAFIELLSCDMIGTEIENDLFKAIDMLLGKQYGLCLSLLNDAEPLSTLAALYTNLRSLWLVRCYAGRDDIAAQTGISPIIVKINQYKKCFFTNEQLKELMLLSINIEQRIKLGGVPIELGVPYFIYKAAMIGGT